jgi:hypothetical protein
LFLEFLVVARPDVPFFCSDPKGKVIWVGLALKSTRPALIIYYTIA